MKTRSAATIICVGISLALPPGAFASGTTTTSSQITATPSQLTPTAPSRLMASRHPATLPDTGYDLLPETLIGFALVGAGVGLKLRRSRP